MAKSLEEIVIMVDNAPFRDTRVETRQSSQDMAVVYVGESDYNDETINQLQQMMHQSGWEFVRNIDKEEGHYFVFRKVEEELDENHIRITSADIRAIVAECTRRILKESEYTSDQLARDMEDYAEYYNEEDWIVEAGEDRFNTEKMHFNSEEEAREEAAELRKQYPQLRYIKVYGEQHTNMVP